ncbi:hypothetical protein Tco_1387864 [Tanacetum coccineum]
MPSLLSPGPTVSFFDDLDFFKDFENEFAAIVYNDTQTFKSDLLTEPVFNPQHIDEFDLNDETSLSEYKEEEQNVLYFNDLFPFNIIHSDDLKSEKDNDDNDIDIIQSSKDMAPLPPREQRHLFLRYQGIEYTDADIADFVERLERFYSREIHRVQVVDFQGMPKLMRDGLFARMVMEHRDDAGVVVFTSQAWGRLFDTRGPLVWELILEFLRTLRFGEFILALGLHTKEEMESPSFARFAAGRNSGAQIFGGQFVARLAEHFGLLTAKILRGLTIIAPELPVIDMAELVTLQIYERLHDTWVWVAMGPERQPDAAAGAPGVAQDAPVIDEGGQADPAPVQAPPPPAAARTMP